jgi:outer membrane protein assembly factor BamB
MTGSGVAGVSAKDGQVMWTSPEGKNGTAIIPTPIFHNNHVYVSSGYGCGCALVKLTPSGDKSEAAKVYANKEMVNHHGGVILIDGHLYGYSDGKGWVCQDLMSGKSVWQEKGKLGKGSVTCADGMLYCYAERDGTVVLAEASPTGWKESGRFKIPKETKIPRKRGQIWTHPVVSDGKLYLRDQDLIFCFDVKNTAADAR